MKRKMLVVTMVIAMMMASLMAACGSNDVPANAIIDTPAPTSTPDPTVEPTITPDDGNDESGVVESGTLDDVPDGNEDGEFFWGSYSNEGVKNDYTSQLQEKGYANEAWSEEHLFTDSPNLAFYISHFVDTNGASMNFSWVGPVGIGNAWAIATDGGGFYLMDEEKAENRKYDLMMFPSGTWVDDNPVMKSTDAQSLMEWALATPYEETYQVEEDSQFYRVTYKVNYVEDGISYTGYACLMDNYALKESYIFRYVVRDDIFDETTVRATIDSIVPINLDDFGIIVEE